MKPLALINGNRLVSAIEPQAAQPTPNSPNNVPDPLLNSVLSEADFLTLSSQAIKTRLIPNNSDSKIIDKELNKLKLVHKLAYIPINVCALVVTVKLSLTARLRNIVICGKNTITVRITHVPIENTNQLILLPSISVINFTINSYDSSI